MNEFFPLNRLRRCRHGCFIYNCQDQIIGRSLDRYGEYSEGELQLLGAQLNSGDVVVDVGANIGVHTVYFAQQVGVHGRVLSLEPQRIVFQVLCGNVALNHLSNVRCVPAAAGAARGITRVPAIDYAVPHNFGGVSLADNANGEEVDVVTIDEFQLAACHLIKIDVEGMEREVISGARDTIQRFRPVLYVENDRQEKSPELVSAIRQLNYRLFWHRTPYFNQRNYLGCTENLFPGIHSINLMCVPAESKRELPDLEEVR